MNDIERKIEEVFQKEVKTIRTVCHNILRAPMYGEKLQDTVTFHLEHFKTNLLRALTRKKEN